jgi:hypothetical protein
VFEGSREVRSESEARGVFIGGELAGAPVHLPCVAGEPQHGLPGRDPEESSEREGAQRPQLWRVHRCEQQQIQSAGERGVAGAQVSELVRDDRWCVGAFPDRPNMLWLLDEIANTAPIHDLPALISQAGGQNLQVMIGLQDLSQARTRWGTDAADGFMSLFQTRLILTGIADTRTLESISISLGEYDRDTVSQTLGRSQPHEWLPTPTHTDTVSYQTQRQRILTPGEIAHLPHGHGLLLTGTDWRLLGLTPWHTTQPWKTIAETSTP